MGNEGKLWWRQTDAVFPAFVQRWGCLMMCLFYVVARRVSYSVPWELVMEAHDLCVKRGDIRTDDQYSCFVLDFEGAMRTAAEVFDVQGFTWHYYGKWNDQKVEWDWRNPLYEDVPHAPTDIVQSIPGHFLMLGGYNPDIRLVGPTKNVRLIEVKEVA